MQILHFSAPVRALLAAGSIVLFSVAAPTGARAAGAAAAESAAAAHSQGISVLKTMARFGVPESSFSVLVTPWGTASAGLSHRASVPMNPASVMKLVTTAAALDTLGAGFAWRTRLYADGTIEGGTLVGNLVIRGAGDPKLVIERLQPMMAAVREAGIARISGDIVLDRSAFSVPELDPGEFDGEPLRPYNSRPDPMLINFKALVMTFTPNAATGVALLKVEPPIAGMTKPASVPLGGGACSNWRAALRANVSNPNALSFAGSYPSSCPELVWPVAYAEPQTHSERAVGAMWAEVGGELLGKVRPAVASDAPRLAALFARKPAPVMGAAPGTVWPLVHESLPLAQIVRDVNKFSNNVMAQHVFLGLGQFARATPVADGLSQMAQPQHTTLDGARAAALRWWRSRLPGSAAPVFDNGSGLSRQERISAQALGDLLQYMNGHRHGPEFWESLPNAGVDGTLGALKASSVAGLARLKTGTLRDATALAGSVQTPGGAAGFVAMYNGPAPQRARQAFYCLLAQVQAGSAAELKTNPLCR